MEKESDETEIIKMAFIGNGRPLNERKKRSSKWKI